MVALLLTSGLDSAAYAAEENTVVSISAVPSIIDLGGSAGDIVPFTFALTNKSTIVLPFHLVARPMLGMEGETNSFLQTNSAQQWVQFDEPDFLIDAGKTKTVAGTLTIPADAGPEGFYADIVVRPLSLRGSTGSVRAQPELAVRLLARVSGKAVEKMETTTEGGTFIITSQSSKRSLSFSLKNAGNVHELVRPVLHITKGGRDVMTKDSEPILLLPREARRISFELPTEVGGGVYEAKLVYDYGTPKKTVSSAEYRLIILPFSPVVVLLVPAGLLSFVFWRYRSRINRAMRILVKGRKAGN